MKYIYPTSNPLLKAQLDQRVADLSAKGQVNYLEIMGRLPHEKGLVRTSENQLNYRYEVIVEEIVEENDRAVLALLDTNPNPETIEVIGIVNLRAKDAECRRMLGARLGNYQITR